MTSTTIAAGKIVARNFFGKVRRTDFPFDQRFPFVNHASYGMPPYTVIEAEQRTYLESLRNIDQWMRKSLTAPYVDSQRLLAQHTKAHEEDLVYVNNATYGINCVINSIDFAPGDVIVTLSTHYWSLRSQLSHLEAKKGAKIVYVQIERKHLQDYSLFIEELEKVAWENKDRLKFAIFDYVGSKPALIYPIKQLTQVIKSINPEARVLADGTHTLGNIEVGQIDQLGCDYFVSSLNKWSFGPVPSAVLWVHPSRQQEVVPICISNFQKNFYPNSAIYENQFQRNFFWQGTADYSKLIGAAAGVQYMRQFGVSEIIQYNQDTIWEAGKELSRLWGTELLVPQREKHSGMINVAIPKLLVGKESQNILETIQDQLVAKGYYFQYLVVDDKYYARFSCQIFNEVDDYLRVGEKFLEKLKELRA